MLYMYMIKYMCMCMCMYMYVHAHVSGHAHVHACVCMCMRVHACVCVCTVEGSVGSEAVESCKSHSQVTQGAAQSSHVRVRERLQRRSVVGLWSRWAWVGRIG